MFLGEGNVTWRTKCFKNVTEMLKVGGVENRMELKWVIEVTALEREATYITSTLDTVTNLGIISA